MGAIGYENIDNKNVHRPKYCDLSWIKTILFTKDSAMFPCPEMDKLNIKFSPNLHSQMYRKIQDSFNFNKI